MNGTQALVRWSEATARHALPVALRWWQRAREGVASASSALVDREVEERIERVSVRASGGSNDPFGWDPEYAKYALFAAAFLSRSYFRTKVEGAERLPPGRALLVANHGGQIPLDGVMIAISVFLRSEPPRIVRAMIEKWASTLPFVSAFFSRCGQVVGVPENARRLLEQDELVLVFPEGTRGLTKTFGRRYQLTDFGLGFMRLALETRSPIIPVSVIGSEEQYVSVANLKTAAAFLRMPALPLVPQLLLPGGVLPLPVRYRVSFGEPLYFDGDPDDDDSVVREKVALVKSTLQSMLRRGLDERRSVFF